MPLVLAAAGFDPLAFDPAAALLTSLTLLVLVVLLGKFAWKPLLKSIEVREERIASAIQKAESDRQHAGELLARYEAQIATAEQAAAALRDKARADAEALGAELRSRAEADAKARLERAAQEIELSTRQALQDLRKEAVTLGMAVATRVVGRSLDGEDQRRLATEVVAGLTQVGRT